MAYLKNKHKQQKIGKSKFYTIKNKNKKILNKLKRNKNNGKKSKEKIKNKLINK